MIKKIVISILVILIVLSAVSVTVYLLDKNIRLGNLKKNSLIAKTSVGAIEYKIVGDQGPVILFFHGTPGGYDVNFHLAEKRILTPSRPGYLQTNLAVGETPEQQAQAFSALLESLDIQSVVVLGMSGGGPAALSFASLFPEKTAALIMLEAVSQSAPTHQGKVLAYLKSDLAAWFFISLLENVFDPESVLKPIMPNEKNRQLILSDPKKINLVNQAMWSFWPVSQRRLGQKNDWLQFQNFRLNSENIIAPTLIIHGNQDGNVSIEQSRMLAQQIKNSRFEIIEGADHFMVISHREQLNEMINIFLDEQALIH